MKISPQARSLLDAMSRDHGLEALSFDRNGLIPIDLGPDLAIAIAFSEASNSFYIMGVLDPVGAERIDPWWAFERNRTLAPRRTRIAIEPKSGALALVCDIFLTALEYWQFTKALDQFVVDLEAIRGDLTAASPGGRASDREPTVLAPTEAFLIFRP